VFSVESQGAVDIIKPLAPLDQENVEEFAETLAAGLSSGQPMVVLDMSDVPLIDSAGLESLLDFSDALHDRGGKMNQAAVPLICQEIHRATRIDQQFDTYDEVKMAVGSFVQ
jgi:anti-sigma B factor antagonist